MTPTCRAALAAALLALAACGGAEGVTGTEFPTDPTTPTTPTNPTSPTSPNSGATAVRITPRTTTLLPGASARLSAGATDAAGNLLPDAAVTWVSLDATTVSAGAGGAITALKVGIARVVALSGSGRDTAVVTVATTPPLPVASVSVTPDVLTMAPGAGQQLAALARDGEGTPLTDRPMAWSSTAAGVATVTANGYVRGVAAGTALVVVAAEGRADTVRVTVRAPGGTPAPVPATVATVSIAPAALDLVLGGAQQLAATAFDAEGQVLGDRTVSWATDDADIATVSAAGRVTAVAPGETRVQATVDGVSAEIVVRVSAPPAVPTTITLSATTLTLGAGAVHDVTATVRDQSGAAMSGYNVAWTTGSAAVATVSATGRITAVGAGTTTITASAAGIQAKVTVTVSATTPPTGSVTLSASSFGSVARSGTATVLLPDVLVAGDDDAAGLTALQAIAIFSLADVPPGATISSATLGITIDTAAAFGTPYALGALHAERTTVVDANTAPPAAGSVLLASSPTPAITAQLTAMVQAAIAAGDDYVAVRFRFVSPSDADAQTDQLELAIGALSVSWTR